MGSGFPSSPALTAESGMLRVLDHLELNETPRLSRVRVEEDQRRAPPHRVVTSTGVWTWLRPHTGLTTTLEGASSRQGRASSALGGLLCAGGSTVSRNGGDRRAYGAADMGEGTG